MAITTVIQPVTVCHESASAPGKRQLAHSLWAVLSCNLLTGEAHRGVATLLLVQAFSFLFTQPSHRFRPSLSLLP